MNTTTITVSIVGAAGYSGGELIRILLRHPHVRIGRLFAASNAGKPVGDVFPHLRGRLDRIFEAFTPDAVAGSDLVFLALPSGEAMHIVPALLNHGVRIVDLGGDFRLKDPTVYELYYKRPHTAIELLQSAVYAFPEWNATELRTASIVSNPGCYPTSVILPLIPLLKAGIIKPHGIVVNSLSGVSGAGRSASTELSFAEVNESVRPYKVGVHQHTPEIEQALSLLTDTKTTVAFIPHLIPITRGILTTTTAVLARPTSESEIQEVMQRAYANASFVRLLSSMPEIKNVANTNFIDVAWKLYERNDQLIIVSAIDNLVKGAAGQAVQTMNLMFGFEESEGLQ